MNLGSVSSVSSKPHLNQKKERESLAAQVSFNFLSSEMHILILMISRVLGALVVTALEKGAARRRHSLDIQTERSLTKETLDQKLLYLQGF